MNDTGDLKKFSFIGAEFIDVNNRSSLLSNPYIYGSILGRKSLVILKRSI
jgi:hypothetical protein